MMGGRFAQWHKALTRIIPADQTTLNVLLIYALEGMVLSSKLVWVSNPTALSYRILPGNYSFDFANH